MEILGRYLASLLLLLHGVQHGNCRPGEPLALTLNQAKPAAPQVLNLNLNLEMGGELGPEIPADATIKNVTSETADGIRTQAFKLEAKSPLRPISYRWGHGTDVVTYFIKLEFFGRFWVVKVVRFIPLPARAVDIRLLKTQHEPIVPF